MITAVQNQKNQFPLENFTSSINVKPIFFCKEKKFFTSLHYLCNVADVCEEGII